MVCNARLLVQPSHLSLQENHDIKVEISRKWTSHLPLGKAGARRNRKLQAAKEARRLSGEPNARCSRKVQGAKEARRRSGLTGARRNCKL